MFQFLGLVRLQGVLGTQEMMKRGTKITVDKDTKYCFCGGQGKAWHIFCLFGENAFFFSHIDLGCLASEKYFCSWAMYVCIMYACFIQKLSIHLRRKKKELEVHYLQITLCRESSTGDCM